MKNFLSKLLPQGWKNHLYHFPLAFIAAVSFGFPGRHLKVIGVTGTNGKTTTTQLIVTTLKQADKKVAMASTINFMIREREWPNTSKFTTLSAWKLQKFLREAVQQGCEYAVVETSSHALDQYRVWGIPYEIAVITNVTREHLDYHHDMTTYRLAKRALFERARMAVVNLDMEHPEEYLTAHPFLKTVTYSTRQATADILARDIVLGEGTSSFTVSGVAFRLQMPGRFNVENALAALGVARLLGIDASGSARALSGLPGVPGRTETVLNHLGLRIIIDYAVTPDSLEKLYGLLQETQSPSSHMIAVLGACGERDRGKRPLMGQIVASYADCVILTNEDPYHEDPERILDEIEVGLVGKEKGESYWRILDRRAAIAHALALARPGDTVVITGKGAELSLAIGERRLPWNERAVVEEELRKLNIDHSH